MTDELAISDVLTDDSKNLCNIYSTNDDEAQNFNLSDSLFYSETEFVDLLTSQKFSDKQNLSIFSINIANLLTKLRSLKLFINNISTPEKSPDIIVVVETHLTKTNCASYTESELKSIIPGYEFYHRDRTTKKGGGVGIFVSQRISAGVQILDQIQFHDEKFENLVMTLPNAIASKDANHKKDLIIAAIYRPPNYQSNEMFESELEKTLRIADKNKNKLVLIGDFNLDLLKYETHFPTANYMDLVINHKLLPRIVRPTRIKKQSATLIDHIFTKEGGDHLVSGIIDTEISGNSGYHDHFPVFSILKSSIALKEKKELICKSFFTKQDSQARRDRLKQEDWKVVLDQDDPNIIYDMIQQKYGFHYNETITIKFQKKRSNRFKRDPWISAEILADMRRRDRLAKQKHRRNDYKKLRNEIVSKIRKAERDHIRQQIEDSYGNIKKHWNIIKKATSKLSNKEDIPTEFHYQGNVIKDPQTNSENINAYYARIGTETNKSVGKPTHSPQHYLQKNSNRNVNSLLFSNVTQDDIIQVCKKFTKKTSTDSSGFQQNIVLSDIDILAPVLAHLVNCSQNTGIFPESGKVARVIPVYKLKGDKQNYENYRPISLLPVFSKILERLIYNKVFEFLVRYEILFESQYGFRSNHNTTHATLDFIKTIEETIESGNYAIGIFCDLSKAFDTLNHEILLDKLDHYGIRGTALMWFDSYLSNRSQYVELNGCKSARLPLKTGVPQGSILGPLLFLLYINDLPSASNLKCVTFADDTNLLIKGKNLEKMAAELNGELENISDYFKANQLKLNPKKTKAVIFRRKSLPLNHEKIQIVLDGVPLVICNDAPFLGITIDGTLSWEKHCTNVANKISRNNSMLNRVKNILPPPTLKILYHSFIQPQIMYGVPAWGGCSAQSSKRIVSIQKRAIRTITKSYFSAHTEPRMKKLGLLKFNDLYEQQCLTLTHDCFYGRAPISIKNFFGQTSSEHNLRGATQNPFNLKIPNFKTRAASNSYSYKGPVLWNNTSLELRKIEQKLQFKRNIKKSILSRYDHKKDCNNPRCKDRIHHS